MTLSKYTELAPGLKISRALTGLWQIADLERDGNKVNALEATKSMKAYVDAGFTTFDMADHYGSSEEITGVFRDTYGTAGTQFFTKWVPSPGKITAAQVREAVEKAMRRMKTDRIDLMQFHAWQYAHPSWVDCLFWLQELKQEGLIGHLGLTNFDTAHLQIVVNSGIEVVSNQVCYSLLDQRAAGDMTSLCLKHGVKLLAFGTVAGGFLSEKWLGKPEPVLNESLTWSQMKYKRFIDAAGGWEIFQNLLHTLQPIAQKHGVGIATARQRGSRTLLHAHASRAEGCLLLAINLCLLLLLLVPHDLLPHVCSCCRLLTRLLHTSSRSQLLGCLLKGSHMGGGRRHRRSHGKGVLRQVSTGACQAAATVGGWLCGRCKGAPTHVSAPH
jgi:aryl-alcohol dehydrogenase-like predicted oxidoreductase